MPIIKSVAWRTADALSILCPWSTIFPPQCKVPVWFWKGPGWWKFSKPHMNCLLHCGIRCPSAWLLHSKCEGKGIYYRVQTSMTEHVLQTWPFLSQGGRHCSLQLLIQPWICAPGTNYGWVDQDSMEIRSLPDQHWESNLRPSDFESKTWSTWSHASSISISSPWTADGWNFEGVLVALGMLVSMQHISHCSITSPNNHNQISSWTDNSTCTWYTLSLAYNLTPPFSQNLKLFLHA